MQNYTGNHVAEGNEPDNRCSCDSCGTKADNVYLFERQEICLACYEKILTNRQESIYYKGEATVNNKKLQIYLEDSYKVHGQVKDRIIILDEDDTFCYEYRVTSFGLDGQMQGECYVFDRYKFYLQPCTENEFIDAELLSQRLLDIID